MSDAHASREDPAPRTHGALREFSLEPADNRRLASLCGPLESNLRLVESRLGVQIRRHGHAFRVRGARAAATESVLRDLFAQSQHREITPEQVHLTLVEHDGELPGEDEANVVLLPAERGERDGGSGGAYRGRRRSAPAACISASILRIFISTICRSASVRRYRQDLSGGRLCRRVPHGRARTAYRAGATGGGGGRAAWISAGGHGAEGGSLSCGRCTTHSTR